MIRFKKYPGSIQLLFSTKKLRLGVTSFSIDALVLPDRSPYELQIALVCSSQDQNSKSTIA
ncbi:MULTISPECIES: hypothetical protein [Methanosarcina]|uniref:hypothetical protein n=1 Tax=Methanosarcina TaxID=2207 RepID=UPI0012F6E1F2|nr:MULTISPECIES: hypothetical protein [Methanosarcina]MCC4768378.1 hypothetical protein [Methanosarcina sp. DH1]